MGLVTCATVRNENAEKERRGEKTRVEAKEEKRKRELAHHFGLVSQAGLWSQDEDYQL
jgi:hypothetical protein